MKHIFLFLFILSSLVCVSQTSKDYADLVDVFWGVDKTSPSRPDQEAENLPRLDKTWYNVREINGATHPGATLPFGMVSCNVSSLSEYIKGYPSGYNGNDFLGLSHFHQTGTGTIRWYYNYILFTPQSGDLILNKTVQKIESEEGVPGWYSCRLNTGIEVETTVAQKSAMHSFTFPKGQQKHLVIDVCHYLKALDTARVVPNQFPEAINIECLSANSASGYVMMGGFPIWFYLELDTSADKYDVYVKNKIHAEKTFKTEDHINNTGFRFSFNESSSDRILSKIGFSFKSLEQAKENLGKDLPEWDLNQYKADAKAQWNEQFTKIKVEDSDAKTISLFYSAIYKALQKPGFCEAENPYWESDNYWVDFSTFWDVYSTHIPFVFTFYPEQGGKIVQFYKEAVKQFKCYPPAYVMKGGLPWVYSKQASALGSLIFADAINRDLKVENKEEMLELMLAELNTERGKLFQKNIPLAPSRTHNIDYSYASYCTAVVASELNKHALADSMLKLSANWFHMYDEKGILIDDRHVTETADYPKQYFNFYEGNKWNYSFKVWHDMQGLIDLHGGDEAFVNHMDWYFNFIENTSTYQFQGLNNEVDYTTPYTYLYAGRPDRTQQIIRVALEYRFNEGRGGLPGNDDSGAMSTWYAWNCMGLFPMTGQDIFLIGSPKFDKVSFSIRGNEFEVVTKNNSRNNVFIQSVTLNGKKYDKTYLSFEEVANGGTLVVKMGAQPSDWGQSQRPPSYCKKFNQN